MDKTITPNIQLFCIYRNIAIILRYSDIAYKDPYTLPISGWFVPEFEEIIGIVLRNDDELVHNVVCRGLESLTRIDVNNHVPIETTRFLLPIGQSHKLGCVIGDRFKVRQLHCIVIC
jgi:hypothetical protein